MSAVRSLRSYRLFPVSLSTFKTAVMMHVNVGTPIPLKTSGHLDLFDMQSDMPVKASQTWGMSCHRRVRATMPTQEQSAKQAIEPAAQEVYSEYLKFTFCVFKTRQRSQQTITRWNMKMLILNETSHSLLFQAPNGPSFVVKEVHVCQRNPSTPYGVSNKLPKRFVFASACICFISLTEQIRTHWWARVVW